MRCGALEGLDQLTRRFPPAQSTVLPAIHVWRFDGLLAALPTHRPARRIDFRTGVHQLGGGRTTPLHLLPARAARRR